MGTLLPEVIEAVSTKGFTFSQWCISGLVPRYAEKCECWRCREKRGETPNERLAMAVSMEARAKMTEDLKPKFGQVTI